MWKELVVFRVQNMKILWCLLCLTIVHRAERNWLICALGKNLDCLIRGLLRRSISGGLALIIIKAMMLKNVAS